MYLHMHIGVMNIFNFEKKQKKKEAKLCTKTKTNRKIVKTRWKMDKCNSFFSFSFTLFSLRLILNVSGFRFFRTGSNIHSLIVDSRLFRFVVLVAFLCRLISRLECIWFHQPTTFLKEWNWTNMMHCVCNKIDNSCSYHSDSASSICCVHL